MLAASEAVSVLELEPATCAPSRYARIVAIADVPPLADAEMVMGEVTVVLFPGEQIATFAVEGIAQLPGGGGGGVPPTLNVEVAVWRVPVLSHALIVSLCDPAAAFAEPVSLLEVDDATCVLSR